MAIAKEQRMTFLEERGRALEARVAALELALGTRGAPRDVSVTPLMTPEPQEVTANLEAEVVDASTGEQVMHRGYPG